MTMRRVLAAVAILSCTLASTLARAEDFPQRPITLILPYAAGGVTDEVARLVASRVSSDFGQPVVVENKPGGAGQIAANAVKQAPADGYTLLVGDIGTHAINASLYSKLSYDPVKDFAPITELVEMPHVLVVPADSPFKTLRELVEAARAQPAKLTYGSVGVGSGAHLLGEMMKAQADIDIVHAPYRGSSQIVPDLIAGRIAMFFGAVGSMKPFIDDGKLRGLVITDKQRATQLPNIYTVIEAGMPDLQLKVWFGVLAPAATPSPIVDILNREFVKALNETSAKQRLIELGANVVGNTPKQFSDVMASDTGRLGQVVQKAGVRLD
jgi:tripartite-type tricarboxylate transporter receptor subunit TctC